MAKKQLTLEAELESITPLFALLEEMLQGEEGKTVRQILNAAEEIFVNIASYAYDQGGTVDISVEILPEPHRICLIFQDEGVPFDPLSRGEVDTTLSSAERKIGGLGILMVKKMMTSVAYQWEYGKNTLTLERNLTKKDGQL